MFRAFLKPLLGGRGGAEDLYQHRTLGDEARDQKDWPTAAHHYQLFLNRRPADFAIWVQLGHALKESNRKLEALAAYNKALHLDGNNADLHLNIGHLHKLVGDREQALKSYARSIASDANQNAIEELKRLIAITDAALIDAEAQDSSREGAKHAGDVPDLTPTSPFVGCLDELLGLVAVGWAWDPRDPHRPACVEFLVGDDVLCTVVVTNHREDVRAHGYGSGLAGFNIELPIQNFDVAQIPIRARIAGTHWELAGGPKLVDVPAIRDLYVSETESTGALTHADLCKPVRHVSDWPPETPVRAIAYYLPQFHPFAENDGWWGRGFTEWTNVTRAAPQFKGHYQPHRPGEMGYYDLRVPEVQERQADLAKQFGLSGFCFYFYWFSGHVLMEEPIAQFASNPKIDFPFCLCWANENWTRRWDGLDSEVLIAQDYSMADDIAFIRHVSKYFSRKNYIKVDGKPLLIIYRAELLPDPAETALRWRTYCRENGVGEIYLGCTQSFTNIDPDTYGFDAAFQFPPNNSGVNEINKSRFDCEENFQGHMYSYADSAWRASVFENPSYKLVRGVYPSWDNTARRRNAGTIFPDSSPRLYLTYLETVAKQVLERETSPDHRMIFVNAWNEWAEGAHLEPDERYGYAYGEATRIALMRAAAAHRKSSREKTQPSPQGPRLAVIVHAFYPELLDELLPRFLRYPYDAEFFFTTPPEKRRAVIDILAGFPHAHEVIATPNRGRDVAPFLRVMAMIRERRFRYVLKLHTKKSTHRNDGSVWRDTIYRDIADPAQLSSLLRNLDANPEIGLLGPDDCMASMNLYWGLNADRVIELSKRLGFPTDQLKNVPFVAGTMFLARVEALELLMGLFLDVEDFEPESGQVDGTLAHALERMVAISAAASSFRICGVSESDECSGSSSEGSRPEFEFAQRTTIAG